MRRLISSVAVGMSVGAMVVSSAGVATAVTATSHCTAINAPAAMNDLPASADCGVSAPVTGGHRATVLSAAAKTVSPTTHISSSPIAFDKTNGDILAITKVASDELAFGGNFSSVTTPDGVGHSAKNFAIVSESTGAVLYAGNASSYVRSIASFGGTTYVGGDFGSFGGSSRSHAAALDSSFHVTSWNPHPAGTIRGMAADSSGVYIGGNFSAVRKVSLSSGSTIWSKSTSSGDVHAVMVDDGMLFAGGLFEKYNGTTQHGLVKIDPASGSLISSFNAHLRADTGVGTYGSYDGEEIISLSAGPNSGEIFIGSGGHAPAGLSSNEAILISSSSGARVWRVGLIGDGQAVGLVGSTVVAGYHRNNSNGSIPFPYFAAQLENSNGALTSWDPKLTGNQGNADGGNNGVQAIYSDPGTSTIYIAGAFTNYNGSSHKSLIAFTWS